ncbi:ComEC/Rec2 family competence protein [Yunchengibacter salinarum]|uniref:ComEC/Rec2 family competence protein n=1 Tax=Yunchengibacter salinarum TaxID=3133399 RepID=UPI0035B578B5
MALTGLVLLALMSMAVLAWRPAGAWRVVSGGLWAFALGAGLAFVAARTLPQVAWQGAEQFVRVRGTVTALEHLSGGPARLTVQADRLVGFSGSGQPRALRLTVRTRMPARLSVGDRVGVQAVIRPPGAASHPGGLDFARHLAFDGVQAVGFAVSDPDRLPPRGAAPGQVAPAPTGGLADLRRQLALTLRDTLPSRSGALAAAFMLGDRSGLDDETRAAMRDAGLAHLLAISGLHMGLLTGLVFFLAEFMIALAPPLALRWAPRKPAAVVAWLAGLGYLLLSGGSTATVRAFIMVSVAFLAVLLDRRVISLRSVALAALALVIWSPWVVTTAAFQMSFAATAGLVAVYEHIRPTGGTAVGPISRVARFFLGVLATTLIAQLAVLPVVLAQFQAVSLVAVLANLVAVPLMSLAVMPLALVQMAVLWAGPPGLVTPLFGTVLDLLLLTAEQMAAMPWAVWRVPQPPGWFLPLMAGLAVAVLMARDRRIRVMAGAAGLTATMLAVTAAPPSEIRVTPAATAVASKKPDAPFRLTARQYGSLLVNAWRQSWGVSRNSSRQYLAQPDCAAGLCLYGPHLGLTLARTERPEQVKHACAAGHFTIAPARLAEACAPPGQFLARETLARRGPLRLVPRHQAGYQAGQVRYERHFSRGGPAPRPWEPVIRPAP